jgi:hypothetical protein
MHDQPKAGSNAAEDLKDERAVVLHVLEVWPDKMRTPDLIRELAASEEFADRDRIDRAIQNLLRIGILIRCDDDMIWPTRQTAIAHELFSE